MMIKSKRMRFEVLTEVKMSMLVFWVVTQCELVAQISTNVSKEHTASIFSGAYITH
jgi:hypothetical protein